MKFDLSYPLKYPSRGTRGSNFLSEHISDAHWPNVYIYQVRSKSDDNCRRSRLLSEKLTTTPTPNKRTTNDDGRSGIDKAHLRLRLM